jgi:hypothetical protein
VKHYLKIELSQLLGVILVCLTIGKLSDQLAISLVAALLSTA